MNGGILPWKIGPFYSEVPLGKLINFLLIGFYRSKGS